MDIQRNAEERWDKKAATYPRYNNSEDTFEAKVLRLMTELNADPSGLHILDVGCGSGKFTLRLAKKAKSVYATDISGEMLRILCEDAGKEGITNITTDKTDWSGFDPKGRKFDIVFCSTTPAVRTAKDFQTVSDLAEKCVVYLGWAGKKDSAIMTELYREHGVTPKMFNDVPVLKDWLKENKVNFKSIVIEDAWSKIIPRDKMKRQCSEMLSDYDVKPKESVIDSVIQKYTDDNGMTSDTTEVRLELIVW